MRLTRPETLFLYFTTCVVNLMSFSATIGLTWTSSAIPRLKKTDDSNPLGRVVTADEESLLGSLYIVGSIVGPFLATPVTSRLGRKLTMVIFTLPTVASFLLEAFVDEMSLYYLARVLGGLTGGCIYTTIPIYVAEISESSNRGALAAFFGIFGTLGNLFSYALGTFVDIKMFSLIALIPPTLMIACLLCCVPETPYHLVAKGDDEGAKRVLRKFRGAACDAEGELVQIKKAFECRQERVGFGELIRDSKKALIIAVVGSSLQQFTGIYAIQIYLQPIFAMAPGGLDPGVATIVIGVAKVVTFLVTVLTVDRLGRRRLLLSSSIGVFVSLGSLGTFFLLGTEQIPWFPVACLVAFVVAFNFGMGSVPLILLGELFPPRFKSPAAVLAVTVSQLLAFLITFAFPLLIRSIGIGSCFWIFAVSGLICFVFTYVLIPETKGKTLLQIQELLHDKPTSQSQTKTEESN